LQKTSLLRIHSSIFFSNALRKQTVPLTQICLQAPFTLQHRTISCDVAVTKYVDLTRTIHIPHAAARGRPSPAAEIKTGLIRTSYCAIRHVRCRNYNLICARGCSYGSVRHRTTSWACCGDDHLLCVSLNEYSLGLKRKVDEIEMHTAFEYISGRELQILQRTNA
jgi:hypothetical protein